MALRVRVHQNNLVRSKTHDLQTMSAETAAALDKELMSTGAYSVDQLMELAGLAVSQAGIDGLVLHMKRIVNSLVIVYAIKPPSKGKRVLIACGPGNNGTLVLAMMSPSALTHTARRGWARSCTTSPTLWI